MKHHGGFVIHKNSRTALTLSYSGPTWDSAGIRHLRCDSYANKEYAEAIAIILSKYNLVGFQVSQRPKKNK